MGNVAFSNLNLLLITLKSKDLFRQRRNCNIEDLQFGLEQIKTCKIKPLLDRAIPLKDAYEAHRLIANNEVSGNIVLLPWIN